jgi:flagellar hook protein FlgE
MGIFDALTTAVSGLQAQSFALQNISGNIANSQTVGYKETDTSFQDLVSAAAQNQQTSGGVFASSVSTNSVQGTIQSTSVSTDMAINGDGYFVVAQPTGQTDNLPVFNSVNYYTRRGDFQMNQAGFLVNGAGYYLMGIPVNQYRQSCRQRAASPPVRQQFRAGAGDHPDPLSGEFAKRTAVFAQPG